MKRKICVVTGSRADYGLMKKVMKEINENENLELQIIATGMHLSAIHGYTYKEIEEDGFVLNHKFKCLTESDSPFAIASAISISLIECSRIFQDMKPDIILLLGDRFEIFAAATAALISRIPIAHVHGGETTLGSYDEAFRHSISKMANIHFVATEEYRQRVIQLGENPKKVYVVGGLGVDGLSDMKLLSREEIEKTLDFQFTDKNLLVTFHPATLEDETAEKQMESLLVALGSLENTSIIFTMANADTGGVVINSLIERFVNSNPNAAVFNSLGRLLYLSCLSQMNGVVGNSSSGILEAPSLKVGTVNIGTRQKGRIQASSVINCDATESSIRGALSELFSENFQLKVKNTKNPYGEGGASRRIMQVLLEIELNGLLKKEFYDL